MRKLVQVFVVLLTLRIDETPLEQPQNKLDQPKRVDSRSESGFEHEHTLIEAHKKLQEFKLLVTWSCSRYEQNHIHS